MVRSTRASVNLANDGVSAVVPAASAVVSQTASRNTFASQKPFAGRSQASLVDARFDHDSCGVGFVASIAAVPSHTILQQALTALGRLAHRGAVAADGKSSDGVGVTTAVPRALLLRETGLSIRDDQTLAVGMLFLPAEETRAEALLERCLASHDLKVLGWREVPPQTSCLGEIALSTMPTIRQVLVVDGLEKQAATAGFDADA